MNKQIRELYRQAHSIRTHDGDPMHDGNPPTVYWQGEVSAARFAELIVRECIDCVRGAGLADDVALRNKLGFNDGISEAVTHIQKHFGVKE